MSGGNCKALIAGAGAGKTTYLINETLRVSANGDRVLLLSYTRANRDEIQRSFGILPHGLTLSTWFSFLLSDGVRPFRHPAIPERVIGITNNEKIRPNRYASKNTHAHYCPTNGIVYSERLSELSIACDDASNGMVFDRIAHRFDLVLIDEGQDLCGYDYDVVQRIVSSGCDLSIVGDPRQQTYRTSMSRLHSKYHSFFDYADAELSNVSIDKNTLRGSHRCCQAILDLANNLYPELPPTVSISTNTSEHEGVYLVQKSELQDYVETYKPLQLRYNKNNNCIDGSPIMNMGDSKGLTVDRTLIYPTNGMLSWLQSEASSPLSDISSAKFYVALTRARFSAAIAVPDNFKTNRRALYGALKLWIHIS